MSEITKIEWADSSWNPWRGCTKVSDGCKNCYAETLSKRNPALLGQWGKGKPRVLAKNWGDPVKWNRREIPSCMCDVKPPERCGCYSAPTVFPSLCDWLDDEVPIEWLARFLGLIYDTPNLNWLLLTKRPENWNDRLEAAALWAHGGPPQEGYWGSCIEEWLGGEPPANVWIGTSVEDQANADRRIPELLKIPAVGRFLSLEPLLSQVDLSQWLSYEAKRSSLHGSDCDRALQGPSGGSVQAGQNEWRKPLGGSVLPVSDIRKESGDQFLGEERVPQGNVQGLWAQDGGLPAPNRVDGSQPVGHTGWHGDQSQGRQQKEQSPREPGVGNAFGKCTPQFPGTVEAREVPERGDKHIRETDGRSSDSDSRFVQKRNNPNGGHENVRRQPENSFRDSFKEDLATHTGINWLICGGESGPGARPCQVEWIQSLMRQGREAGVPTFIKQLGARPLLKPCRQHHFDWRHNTSNADRPDDELFSEEGEHWRIRLNHPKGGDPAEWIESLRVREMPEGLR